MQINLQLDFKISACSSRYAWFVGTTVFRGTWNFEPSHGISVFAEFCRIRY